VKLGRVVGTVVATRKSPKLVGTKLLLVEECDVEGKPKGAFVVAADTVGAGVGETVLLVAGSSARLAYPQEGTPIDAAISGIIDAVEYNGKVTHPNRL
jgi:microcompartment protein CcmK/EutM